MSRNYTKSEILEPGKFSRMTKRRQKKYLAHCLNLTLSCYIGKPVADVWDAMRRQIQRLDMLLSGHMDSRILVKVSEPGNPIGFRITIMEKPKHA